MPLPPLDYLCFIIFPLHLPLYGHTLPTWHSIAHGALCITLFPSCSYTIHCGVYSFFSLLLEDLVADLISLINLLSTPTI